jgi:hypothetical protein
VTRQLPISNQLATCSYREFKDEMGVLVGTSTGNCRNRSGVRYARTMAPYSIFKKGLDDPELELAIYWKQLDDDHEKIEAEWVKLGADYPGQTLVFACFEDLTKAGLYCHRTWLGSWITSRYGTEVTELGKTR